MKQEYQKLIEKVLPEVLKNAEEVKAANKLVPISGKRIVLPLKNRNIDAAFYAAKSENAPLFLGFHGGGFLFGGSALDDELWVEVSTQLDVNVLSVNYRMSPEVRDYESLYDCYDAAVYVKDHAKDLAFHPDHISVFGSSAGGNLAAAVVILAKQRGEIRFDNQILMYPFLDGATDPDSKGEGSFSGVLPHIMNQLHFSPELAKDPLLSPYYADISMLKDLPPAIIAYCEYDNLRQEAVEYCSKLEQANVPVYRFYAEHMPHGYIENGFKDNFTSFSKDLLGEHAEEIIRTGLLRQRSQETLDFIRKTMIR